MRLRQECGLERAECGTAKRSTAECDAVEWGVAEWGTAEGCTVEWGRVALPGGPLRWPSIYLWWEGLPLMVPSIILYGKQTSTNLCTKAMAWMSK